MKLYNILLCLVSEIFKSRICGFKIHFDCIFLFGIYVCIITEETIFTSKITLLGKDKISKRNIWRGNILANNIQSNIIIFHQNHIIDQRFNGSLIYFTGNIPVPNYIVFIFCHINRYHFQAMIVSVHITKIVYFDKFRYFHGYYSNK